MSLEIFFKEIANNRVLWTSLSAWFIAQLLKGIFYFFKEKRINFRRFVGAGGMPSSHSALVASLATATGMNTGWNSIFTAFAVVLGGIVMYDASGVRLAAGRQAAVLNKIVDEIFEEGEFHQERLKELLGHTPIEVIAGALLGIGIALLLG
ncbi:MAG TPA: divergent PAP2 family protein [Bacillota bacterium]|nr:divergent PAP2 family protein [Bacillota bacterium]HOL09398.1 divergent PAP2 family protein [Bacillota bacterium]HPO97122.1 divergent PAP2 family protein [Bacillota bacterium]